MNIIKAELGRGLVKVLDLARKVETLKDGLRRQGEDVSDMDNSPNDLVEESVSAVQEVLYQYDVGQFDEASVMEMNTLLWATYILRLQLRYFFLWSRSRSATGFEKEEIQRKKSAVLKELITVPPACIFPEEIEDMRREKKWEKAQARTG